MASVLRANAEPRTSAVPLERGGEQAGRGIRLAALRVPLALKLVGANVALVALLVAVASYDGLRVSTSVIALALVAIVAHAVIVIIALHPIRELESVARRVWGGDYAVSASYTTEEWNALTWAADGWPEREPAS